jgi:hypothetical protein
METAGFWTASLMQEPPRRRPDARRGSSRGAASDAGKLITGAARRRIFGSGPAYDEWLSGHQGAFVFAVAADFGPGGSVRLAAGSLDLRARGLSKVLHRATCENVRSPGEYDTSICAPYEELARELARSRLRSPFRGT